MSSVDGKAIQINLWLGDRQRLEILVSESETNSQGQPVNLCRRGVADYSRSGRAKTLAGLLREIVDKCVMAATDGDESIELCVKEHSIQPCKT